MHRHVQNRCSQFKDCTRPQTIDIIFKGVHRQPPILDEFLHRFLSISHFKRRCILKLLAPILTCFRQCQGNIVCILRCDVPYSNHVWFFTQSNLLKLQSSTTSYVSILNFRTKPLRIDSMKRGLPSGTKFVPATHNRPEESSIVHIRLSIFCSVPCRLFATFVCFLIYKSNVKNIILQQHESVNVDYKFENRPIAFQAKI